MFKIITPGAQKLMDWDKEDDTKAQNDAILSIIEPVYHVMFLVAATINGISNPTKEESEFSDYLLKFVMDTKEKDPVDQMRILADNMELVNKTRDCMLNEFRLK